MKPQNHNVILITFFDQNGRGDVLLLTPALRALQGRFPNARIVVVANHTDLLKHNPVVTLAVEGAGAAHTLTSLRTDAHAHVHIDYRPLCLPNQLHHMTAVICALAGLPPEPGRPELLLTTEEKQFGIEVVMGLASSRRQQVVAIHTGASTANRRWPLSRWCELVSSLPQVTFVQLGGDEDTGLPGVADLRGRLSLRQAASVLLAAHGAVLTDSWMNHAAAALDARAVVLFGASHPRNFGYRGHFNLFAPNVACAPCYRPAIWRGDLLGDGSPWECPHRLCLDNIPVQDVKNAIFQRLDKTGMVHGEAI